VFAVQYEIFVGKEAIAFLVILQVVMSGYEIVIALRLAIKIIEFGFFTSSVDHVIDLLNDVVVLFVILITSLLILLANRLTKQDEE
jgi:hypothetical protein